MPTTVNITPVYVLDLDEALRFYTEELGFELRDDVDFGTMRWLSVGAPGDDRQLLLALVEHHVPPVDQPAMRELVAKGTFPVFLTTDQDVDALFEGLRAKGVEVLQEPTTQPYGLRDCAVRDPSGNHLRLGQWVQQPA